MPQHSGNGTDEVDADLYGYTEALEPSHEAPKAPEDPREALRLAALRTMKSRGKRDKSFGSGYLLSPAELEETIPGLACSAKPKYDAGVNQQSSEALMHQQDTSAQSSTPAFPAPRRRVYHDIDAPSDSGDSAGSRPVRQRQRVSYADEAAAPAARSADFSLPWLEFPKTQVRQRPAKRISDPNAERYPQNSRRFIGVQQSWDSMVIELSDDDDDDDADDDGDGDDDDDCDDKNDEEELPSAACSSAPESKCKVPALEQKEREIQAMLLRIQALERRKMAPGSSVLGKRGRTEHEEHQDVNKVCCQIWC